MDHTGKLFRKEQAQLIHAFVFCFFSCQERMPEVMLELG